MVGRLLLLAGVASAVMVPIFVGHGLAAQSGGAIVLGVGFLGVAALLVFLHVWTARGG